MTKATFSTLGAIAICFAGFCLSGHSCLADSISPQIKDGGESYSEAIPDASIYGNGLGSELAEASVLRFEGEHKLRERKYDEAIEKFLKAVQFDPSDPQSHILLARGLTAKIMHSKELPESKMLQQAIHEWKMIWHHDADQSDQVEAKSQARILSRLAKSIEKNQIHTMAGHAELLSKSRDDRDFGFGM
jgi:tetratricopeptide (TPR) repeat protein